MVEVYAMLLGLNVDGLLDEIYFRLEHLKWDWNQTVGAHLDALEEDWMGIVVFY